MSGLTRRNLLRGTAMAGVGLLSMTGCGRGPGAGGKTDLQFAWWGNDERDRRTKTAIERYQKAHSDVTIRPQITGWDGYWDKLATQTAGGAPPDLIQMSTSYITAYADRGALLALDGYVPKDLQIGDFSKEILSPGLVDGKLYSVNWGINALAMMCNSAVIKTSGVELPDDSMTWDDFADLAAQISASTDDGVFGTENGMVGDRTTTSFDSWIMSRGKTFYDETGQLAFDAADMLEWFEYWERLVSSKVAPPADIQTATSGDIADGMVARGKAAFEFSWSNQLAAYSDVAKDEILIHLYPQGNSSDAVPGQYYHASMMLSVSARTEQADAAVAFANALLTDVGVAGELGYERGVPPSKKVQEALLPDATPPETVAAKFIEGIADKIRATPPVPPPGDAEVSAAYTYASEQAGFGKVSNAAAVDKFFDDAQEALT
jgi:multiple sugar transport system substrate-binding protein